MRFHILSFQESCEFYSEKPYVFISITDPIAKTYSSLIRHPNYPAKHLAYQLNQHKLKDVLRLFFWDIDTDNPSEISEEYRNGIFTWKQANHILTFYEKWQAKVNRICVHCYAGVSRSSGVVSALEIISNGQGSDEWILEPHRRFIPNQYVKNLILKAANERGLI